MSNEDAADTGIALAGRLDRFFRLSIALVFVILAVLGVRWTVYSTYYSPQLGRLIQGQTEVSDAGHAMLDMESGLRGYQLSADERFLEPYADGLRTHLDAETRMARTLAGNRALSLALTDEQQAAQRWQVEYAAPALATAQQHTATADDGTLEHGRQLFDAYRGTQATLAAAERRALQATVVNGERIRDAATLVELAIGAVLVWYAARRRRRLRTEVVEPVADILATLDRVADGDLAARPATTTTRELARIGAGIGQLAESIAVEQSVRLERERRAIKAANMNRRILALAREFTSTLEEAAVVAAVGRALTDLTDASTGTVWLPESDTVLRAEFATPGAATPGRLVTTADGSTVGRSARTGEVVDTADGEARLLVVPLMSAGRCQGVVELTLPDVPQHATLVESVQTLALHAASALAAARLHAQVSDLSERDSLTGLYNRRRLDAELAAALQQAAEHGTPVSYVMLDVDHFKTYNDTHGHPEGDALLRELADALAETVRASDTAYRYGGEEFAILLPGATAVAAQSLAERLRQLVARRFLHQGVTASFGVAAFPDLAASGPELVEAADAALYDAKRLGRNRVQVAQPLVDELATVRDNAGRS